MASHANESKAARQARLDDATVRATALREEVGRVVLSIDPSGPGVIVVNDPLTGQEIGRARIGSKFFRTGTIGRLLEDMCDSTREMYSRELHGDTRIDTPSGHIAAQPAIPGLV